MAQKQIRKQNDLFRISFDDIFLYNPKPRTKPTPKRK